jgi:thiamine biosynthesis lipoprotein
MSGTERREPVAPLGGEGASSAGGVLHSFTHRAMACEWEIALYHPDARYAEQAARTAFAEVDRLEQELSRFIATSDIAQLNRLQPGQTLRLGADAVACLVLARELHQATGGAFDPTIGALLPNARRSADAPRWGMRALQLDAAARTVRVEQAGLIVDLGALGKGYAVDRAVEVLREWGIAAARVHSGQSTVFCQGAPPGARGWTISVRDPDDHVRTLGKLELRDAAFSGSGLALHGAHIIDPRRGEPAGSRRGAWALAPTAALSDAASTAFVVMSDEEIFAYCRARGDVRALCAAGDSRCPLWTCGDVHLTIR